MRWLGGMLLALALASAASADPKTDYLLYCRGCHLENGAGVPPDVPSLHNTLGRLLASPAGRAYIVRVPGVAQTPMDDARLAAVLNWVLLEFNAATLPETFLPYSASEVGDARRDTLDDPLKLRAIVLADAP